MLRMVLSIVALSACLAAPMFAQTASVSSSASKAAAAKPPAMINVNTATAEELETLPGIGPKVAARIIEYRKAKGPFKKPEELMNVQGIGEKSFLKLRPQVTVGAKGDNAGQE